MNSVYSSRGRLARTRENRAQCYHLVVDRNVTHSSASHHHSLFNREKKNQQPMTIRVIDRFSWVSVHNHIRIVIVSTVMWHSIQTPTCLALHS